MEQPKDNNLLKALIITLILTILGISVIYNEGWAIKPAPVEHQIPLSVRYKNKENVDVKIRYKYMLSYTSANDEVEAHIDNQRPLFALYDETGTKLTEQLPSNNPNTIVPEISEVITLKPDEVVLVNLEVKVDEKYKNIQNKILFETFIIVEEIVEGKWSPVYQVRLMERGDYYRLEKLPVEKFE